MKQKDNRHMIIVLILVIIVLELSSCQFKGRGDERVNNNEMPVEMPDDFNVIFSYGVYQANQHDGIDTKAGTLQKDLVVDGLSVTNYEPDRELLEKIYKYLYEVNILSYPNLYQPLYQDNPEEGVNVVVTPSMVYDLTIIYGEVEHHIYWHNNNASKVKEAIELEDAYHNIMRLIYNINEFKELGEPNGGYD